MRDLDEKIAEWRTRMAAGGVKTPAVLDELETHLREDVEQQIRAGKEDTAAFELAERRIGGSDLLKAEFAKIERFKEVSFGRLIGAACCVAAALYSMVLAPVLLTVPELGSSQRFLGSAAVSLTLLFLASLRFGYRYLPVIRSRRRRLAAVSACALAGIIWLFVFSNLLPNVIVPRLMDKTISETHYAPPISAGFENPNLLVHNQVSLAGDHRAAQAGFAMQRTALLQTRAQLRTQSEILTDVFNIGISLFWAMTVAAALGGAAFGLEEAARRRRNEDAYV
jgi:hypothetical protein